MFTENESFVSLSFWNVLHGIVSKADSGKFPVLHEIANTHKRERLYLTASTAKTLQFISSGFTIDEIAVRRGLKKNTIEDHIVEIALNDPAFEYEGFISTDQLDAIVREIKNKNTFQLKVLKEALKHEYSYFQIRLAVAVAGKEILHK
nr:helix-turn-helix domain-containing protein [Metabacillus lacus]